ncbi:condensin complex subunit 1-like isoform X2 [Mytilus californianus]|uniref:condensin complex subunit 1-like isoform X2 n=1 Tax=Mytilus californianus TaxID=6549 RepID=UPI0022480976|nr:condensin complex subunit 1-like isoform X2 [Mytilus californianus]
MSFEFVIPSSRDDLLNRTGIDHFVVSEIATLREIPGALQELKTAFRSQGSKCLLHKFDSLFSVICLQKDVSGDLKEEAWQLLIKIAQSFVNNLATTLDETSIEPEIRKDGSNMVKMICYLLSQFFEIFEAEDTQPSASQVVGGKGRRGKKKPSDSGIDWDREKECGIKVLLHLVTPNIHRLWDPPIVEEEFVTLVTNCGYRLLENPSITRVTSKETRDAISHLIGVMAKRYNHALSASLKILQLLQHFEHLVSPLAHTVEIITNELGVKSVIQEIMREVGRLDPKDIARDPSGTRCISAFLVEVAEKIPLVMLPSISVLMCHLDEESYTLRNGVLGVMGEILLKVLSKDDLDNKMKLTRDQFLECLTEHIHDVNAFVRSKLLQIWWNIVNEKCLPLTWQDKVLTLVIGRLADKSSQVRKNSIQLVTAFIKCNPFAAKLSVEELKENYEKEKEKLKEMTGGDEEMETDSSQTDSVTQKIDEEWKPLKTKLKRAIKIMHDKEEDGVEEEGNNGKIPENETSESVIKQINNLISEEKYEDAVTLTWALLDVFPQIPVFVGGNAEDEEEGGEEPDLKSLEKTLEYLYKIFSESKKPGLVLSEQPVDEVVVNEISKQQIVVQYLKDSLLFATQIQKAVPMICQLLGSKSITDVLEAVEFFITGFEFGLGIMMMGIRRMLPLIWSRESGIKEAVVGAYKRLYLSPADSNQRSKSLTIVKNLSALVDGATMGDLTSLEGLIVEFVKSEELDQSVIQMLWERFTMKVPNTTQQDSRAALMLLSMAAGANAKIVQSNVDILVKEGLGSRATEDFILAKDTCITLLKLGTDKKAKGAVAKKPYRLPEDHEMFIRLSELLINNVANEKNNHWIALAEQAVKVIYKLSEHPDDICGNIIKSIADKLIQIGKLETTILSAAGDSQPSDDASTTEVTILLTRLVSIAGSIAFSQMIHVDNSVLGELKRRRAVQEEKKKKPTKKQDKSRIESEAIEDELGLAGAAAEDAEVEYIRRICEQEIVTGNNLLGILGPLLVTICQNQTKYSSPQLRTAATMAMSKFMMVSSSFCEDNLQLLFTILEKSSNPVIRANTIIALGDLTFRFPNLIEPWTAHIYGRLRDTSTHVRKNTMQILTHLILNDMVKVKGQISEMAMCIVDDDERISGLAKLFFSELSKKGNAVYNIMPDVISRLSDPDIGVDEENFRTIMKYLFSFIQKDKQCESLVEKLCHRFRATTTDRQWRDLSFCLSMLSYSIKGLRKLQENFTCFGDKLADDDVYGMFCQILSKSKSFAKPDMKALLDELEQRIELCHQKGLEEEEIAHKASQASDAAADTQKHKKKGGKTGKTPVKRSHPKKWYER